MEPYRLGPLELILLCACSSAFLVAAGVGVYWLVRKGTKAGIEDARKE